ncbi:tRNA dihydrouridine(20/20a) synthase DusA [Planktotalea sp.]|uniref:tRNA dihydrouridine(20/20a) synthase DusA n=1 Tax=Planktotalea sp. TaxID=2029877 RepID=UPI0025D7141B|nr:tRNA dihydrouridine(20/20a) synthase DusA [Planktotalea sp.]
MSDNRQHLGNSISQQKKGFTTVSTAARLSVAPMMDWTDRHCRYFHRLLSQRALLYTEMVTSPALVRGGALHLLEYSPEEHPVALQLGGSDPAELAEAARLGAEAGYDEINLNVGCPSDRVQNGAFGAILMRDPKLVAACCAAMRAATDVEITVKCRIGVDDQEPSDVLPEFIARVAGAGVARFSIHARKAWLQGLSPKENRDIPPLDYDLVQQMKGLFPALHLSLNGGVATLDVAEAALERGMDGVMIGRAAYHQSADILLEADHRIFGDAPHGQSREDIVLKMLPYIDEHMAKGGKLGQVTRHMLGIFAGKPGARHWKRHLSENAHKSDAGSHTVVTAIELMQAARPAFE